MKRSIQQEGKKKRERCVNEVMQRKPQEIKERVKVKKKKEEKRYKIHKMAKMPKFVIQESSSVSSASG